MKISEIQSILRMCDTWIPEPWNIQLFDTLQKISSEFKEKTKNLDFFRLKVLKGFRIYVESKDSSFNFTFDLRYKKDISNYLESLLIRWFSVKKEISLEESSKIIKKEIKSQRHDHVYLILHQKNFFEFKKTLLRKYLQQK